MRRQVFRTCSSRRCFAPIQIGKHTHVMCVACGPDRTDHSRRRPAAAVATAAAAASVRWPLVASPRVQITFIGRPNSFRFPPHSRSRGSAAQPLNNGTGASQPCIFSRLLGPVPSCGIFGKLTPTRQSRVTSSCSCASLQASVPAGLNGILMNLKGHRSLTWRQSLGLLAHWTIDPRARRCTAAARSQLEILRVVSPVTSQQ